jgi:hypothetical protein
MSNPIASITLTPADLVRLASPRLLTEFPFLGMHQDWVFDLVRVPAGIRLDVIAPAGENGQ